MSDTSTDQQPSEQTSSAETQPQPTQEIQEGNTPQEEALYRIQEGVAAPTSADYDAAENPAEAQDYATVALLMGDRPPPPEESPSIQEFVDKEKDEDLFKDVELKQLTEVDLKQRENLEVRMLSSENMPKEYRKQQLEGLSHLPHAVVPEQQRSLSLEELAMRKVEYANPGVAPPA